MWHKTYLGKPVLGRLSAWMLDENCASKWLLLREVRTKTRRARLEESLFIVCSKFPGWASVVGGDLLSQEMLFTQHFRPTFERFILLAVLALFGTFSAAYSCACPCNSVFLLLSTRLLEPPCQCGGQLSWHGVWCCWSYSPRCPYEIRALRQPASRAPL